MPVSVLIVEDEAPIRELLECTLSRAGFAVRSAPTAEDAIALLKVGLSNVCLVDWMLPRMSGLDLVRKLRQDERTATMPIIMVSGRDAEPSRVTGLDAGADDYIAKPFSPREMVARIRALIRRRAPQHSDRPLEVGPLRLDAAAHTATLDGKRLELRLVEFKLLRFLMAHPNCVFSRSQLLDQVWGDDVYVEERTVDVHVRRLRLSLGTAHRDLIATVRGGGYKLASEPPPRAGTNGRSAMMDNASIVG